MCTMEAESYDYDSPFSFLGICRVQAKYHTMAGGGAFGTFSIDIVSLALMELPLRVLRCKTVNGDAFRSTT